jgi:predicted urease superfamily metal-dependent hydrolase
MDERATAMIEGIELAIRHIKDEDASACETGFNPHMMSMKRVCDKLETVIDRIRILGTP